MSRVKESGSSTSSITSRIAWPTSATGPFFDVLRKRPVLTPPRSQPWGPEKSTILRAAR